MHAILFKLNFPIPRFLNNADEAVPACADQAMGAGMDELLQHYERELGTLHAHNQAFARRYPAIAGALGIVGRQHGQGAGAHNHLEKLL
ncbi:type VI secretion system baseplate subunit TssF [Janthinobacterium sp. PSRC1-1]|uniref:type VI secretion system baseplate subunit TssF n=1 Tax=Janthinobacterium sp. PSRC1-1 TaxID=2804586 RepID=UPI003CF9704E